MTAETFTPQVDADLTPPKRWPNWICTLVLTALTAASWALLIGLGFGLAAFLGLMGRLFLAYFGGV